MQRQEWVVDGWTGGILADGLTHGRVIVSLADMEKIDFARMSASLTYAAGVLAEWKAVRQVIAAGLAAPASPGTRERAEFLACFERLRRFAEQLDLPGTKRHIERSFDRLAEMVARPALDAHSLGHVIGLAEPMVLAFVHEIDAGRFLYIRRADVDLLEPMGPLFGREVSDAFPESVQDIADAGACRAFEMWTACVMHLMRALEPALAALARHVGVADGHNWNRTLNEVEARLGAVTRSTDGDDAERWAAEAALHLRNIKNAWRNHAMHARARYNQREAEAISAAVESLLRMLAARLGN